MNLIIALIIAIVGATNDTLPSCAPVDALVAQVNAAVSEGDGVGDGYLFVTEDCSIDYQD